MKAFALTEADKPAAVVDLPDPVLTPGAVRIRIHAASVNGFDVYQASGQLVAMMEHQLPTTIGRDFAGVVDAVGAERTDVALGDEVIGFIPSTPPLHDGAFAEAVVTSDAILAPKPSSLDFVAAAAIPLAGATALEAVDAVDVGPGDTLLIVGATGGVGSFAVQLAAGRGATVIATARAGEEDAFVRGLGATETVDYEAGDVAEAIRRRHPDGVTALIDVVNRGDAFEPIAELVRDGGRIATTLGAADPDALSRRSIRATNVSGAPTAEKLTRLADDAAAGRLAIHIQQTFPLEEVGEAIAAFGRGTLGKIVVRVD